MKYRVIYSPEARKDLRDIRRFIRNESSAHIAAKFVEGLFGRTTELEVFPRQGTERSDIRSGLRIIGYRRASSIHFEVTGTTVVVLRIFYRGRNWSDDYSP